MRKSSRPAAMVLVIVAFVMVVLSAPFDLLQMQASVVDAFVAKPMSPTRFALRNGISRRIQSATSSSSSPHIIRGSRTRGIKRTFPIRGKALLAANSDFSEEDFPPAGEHINDLSWRVNKLRLEEENKKRFLKAKPRFLPYDECRKWVQAIGRWKTEEDWTDWIAMGEKRNAYIPSCPDQYYGGRGEWISWEHFLGTQPSNDSNT